MRRWGCLQGAQAAVAQSSREINGNQIDAISLTADRTTHYKMREQSAHSGAQALCVSPNSTGLGVLPLPLQPPASLSSVAYGNDHVGSTAFGMIGTATSSSGSAHGGEYVAVSR
jgi:hypothetical protein